MSKIIKKVKKGIKKDIKIIIIIITREQMELIQKERKNILKRNIVRRIENHQKKIRQRRKSIQRIIIPSK